MKKSLLIVFSALVCISAFSKPKDLPLKVGTYNICTSDSRAKKIKQGKFITNQRLYSNSADALAAMIASLDCDVMGFQEICDSIWGVKGKLDLRDKVAKARGDNKIEWILFPNTTKGNISYDDAICYNTDRLKLKYSGIYWLTENENEPAVPSDAPKGSNRPVVWATFKDLATGVVFNFFSTHLVLGSMHKDGGTEYNATHFVRIANEYFSEKEPSIVVGDFNAGVKSEAFKIMTSSRWKDCFTTLQQKGEGIEAESLNIGSQPTPDESTLTKGRIDHILFDKFTPETIYIDTRKFPTADGTLHYPSDHLPVVATFRVSDR